MLIPLYNLIFEDGTRFLGGDVYEPNWFKAPDKAISFMEIRLPSGDFLLLTGYDEYLLMVEATQDFGVKQEVLQKRVEFLYVMGCKDNMVRSYRIVLNDAAKFGDMTVREYPKGKEYFGRSTVGWHKGVKRT